MATKPTTTRWTEDEVAFIFNYADECLHDKTDFKETSENAILEYSGRKVTAGGINSKISTYLKECNPKVTYSQFMQYGVRCLDAREISPKLLTAMREQRPQRLGNLQFREIAESAARTEQVLSSARHRSQKSYREDSVPDSNSSKEDLEDGDYVDGTPGIANKIQSGGNTVTVLLTNKHRNGHASAAVKPDPIIESNNAAGKRKASTIDVVDLSNSSDIAPAPKRPALDKRLHVALVNTQEQDAPKDASSSGQWKIPSGEMHKNRTQTQLDDAPEQDAPPQIADYNPSGKTTLHLEHPDSAIAISRRNQADNKALQAQINHLTSLVLFKMEKDLTHEEISDSNIRVLLNAVTASEQVQPARLAAKLLDIADSACNAKQHYLAIIKGAFGGHPEGTTLQFPPTPTAADIARVWRDAQYGIREGFTGHQGYPIRGIALNEMSAGYIACIIDSLLADSGKRKNFTSSLGIHLNNPYAGEALTSALLCRWLFATPDSMCEGQHNTPQLLQYKTLSVSHGLAEVQRLDKVAFGALFADADFQKTTLKTILQTFVKRFEIIPNICPSAPGLDNIGDAEGWAEKMFKLKQRLMISPLDYRVHFCHPGTPFDSAWMIAEDNEGFPVQPANFGSKTVRMCLFPALVKQDPKAFEDTVDPMEDALIKNKKFLPSWSERSEFDASRVVGKATVLVD